MPPSGIEMNSIPPAMMKEFFSADQKSGSLKMNSKPARPSVRLASKNGAFSTLWNRMKPSGSATATLSTATTSQRSSPANGCSPPRGSAPIVPPSAARGGASRCPVALVESMSVPLQRESRISTGSEGRRGVRAFQRRRHPISRGLALDRLLPLLEEFKPLGLVEIDQQAGADRDRLE
jgi:hypothetical protein